MTPWQAYRVRTGNTSAFGALFALSASVGPILGQNMGRSRHDRLQSTMRDSLKVVVGYVLVMWLALAFSSSWIANAFQAEGESREMIVFFCTLWPAALSLTAR